MQSLEKGNLALFPHPKKRKGERKSEKSKRVQPLGVLREVAREHLFARSSTIAPEMRIEGWNWAALCGRNENLDTQKVQ